MEYTQDKIFTIFIKYFRMPVLGKKAKHISLVTPRITSLVFMTTHGIVLKPL